MRAVTRRAVALAAGALRRCIVSNMSVRVCVTDGCRAGLRALVCCVTDGAAMDVTVIVTGTVIATATEIGIVTGTGTGIGTGTGRNVTITSTAGTRHGAVVAPRHDWTTVVGQRQATIGTVRQAPPTGDATHCRPPALFSPPTSPCFAPPVYPRQVTMACAGLPHPQELQLLATFLSSPPWLLLLSQTTRRQSSGGTATQTGPSTRRSPRSIGSRESTVRRTGTAAVVWRRRESCHRLTRVVVSSRCRRLRRPWRTRPASTQRYWRWRGFQKQRVRGVLRLYVWCGSRVCRCFNRSPAWQGLLVHVVVVACWVRLYR